MVDLNQRFGLFWFSAQKLVALMERNVARRLRGELEIGSMQYRVLSAVQVQRAGFNQRDVAAMLGTTDATVSRQIDAAASAGYVIAKASVNSRRERDVQLTEAGMDIVSRGDAIIAQESEAVLLGVEPGNFDLASQTIRQMLENLDESTGPVATDQAG